MDFCTDAGQGDELARRMARVEISPGTGNGDISRNAPSTHNTPINVDVEHKTIPTLMMAMRKLREGIVASNRVDDFAIQAYIFCIRLSILVKHMESYHPAILHLLKKMHPIHALTNTELQEFVGYLVLDLACRQNDLTQAFSVRYKYKLRESKVDAVLRSLAHDNYFLFWRVKQSVDGHKAKLMEFAEVEMRKQTLKCLGRAYLSIDRHSLEQYTHASWPSLCKDCGVGWQLESNKVIIRKPKVR
jgi:CSN8/PSMD8/EIF3K family